MLILIIDYFTLTIDIAYAALKHKFSLTLKICEKLKKISKKALGFKRYKCRYLITLLGRCRYCLKLTYYLTINARIYDYNL